MVGSDSDPVPIRRYIYGNRNTSSGSSDGDDGDNMKSSTGGAGVMDTTYHTGNKSLSSTGQERIQEFCHLLFRNNHPVKDSTITDTTTTNGISHAQNYIVTGHSLWFLTFFQLLLPTSCHHVAKKKKLQNGSIIGFTLLHTTTTSTTNNESADHYMIDPTSLVVVHGGF